MTATQFVSIITIKGSKPRIDQRVLGCFTDVIKEREQAIDLHIDKEDKSLEFVQNLIVKIDGKVIETADIDIEGKVTVTTDKPIQCIQCQNKPTKEDAPVYDEEGRCPKCYIDVLGVK